MSRFCPAPAEHCLVMWKVVSHHWAGARWRSHGLEAHWLGSSRGAEEGQVSSNYTRRTCGWPKCVNQLISVSCFSHRLLSQRWKRTCDESRRCFSEALPHHLKNGWVSWCFLCGCHLARCKCNSFLIRGWETVVDAQTCCKKKPQWTRVFGFPSSCDHCFIL